MTDREAFILTCIELTRMDGELSPEEMNSCLETLEKLGFTSAEFDSVEEKMDQFSEDDLILSIQNMSSDMKKNLLLAMQDIAGSDLVDSSEVDFINTIKKIISKG